MKMKLCDKLIFCAILELWLFKAQSRYVSLAHNAHKSKERSNKIE